MVGAVGADRPGVIAAISGVLVELGCNLSDTQMAVLQGYASMMLVVDAPDPVTSEMLQSSLTRASEGLGHALWVQPLSDSVPGAVKGERWLVSVHGADRPGVVFEATRALADAGVNVVGLESRLSGTLYALTMQVDVPPGVDGGEVAIRLDRLCERLAMSCSMRPAPERSQSRAKRR
jgi:glycine cleavage system transcriptional repressor